MKRALTRPLSVVLATLISAPGAPSLAAEIVRPNLAPKVLTGPFAAAGAASPTPPLAPAIAAMTPAESAAPIAGPAAAAPLSSDSTLPAKTASGARKLGAQIAGWFRAATSSADDLPPPADAVDSLAQAPLSIDPSRVYHPSPVDWRDESLYSAVLDRFSRGRGAVPIGDPKDGGSRHGGNLRGVIDRLDYLQNLGVTTILVSPVTMTVPEAYHGYAPIHFLAIDPHLGSMADFKELVAKAHEKGLRVVLDWVLNHSGPVFEYADGKTQWTGDNAPGPVTWTRPLKPVELTEDDFTRERVITNWSDPVQATHGDFPPNYRHFATDRRETQDKLIHIAQWWIKETDVDGLRLDAVRHLAPGFLPRFSRAIRSYTNRLGKANFLLLGENSTGVDGELDPYLRDGSLDTLYDYPAFRRENAALHGQAPTRVLEDSTKETQAALGINAGLLVRFIDLHDVYRYLLADTPSALLKTALTYLMTTLGIPLVYYGTEQAFRQLRGRIAPEGGDMPADPQNREDMFPEGQYKSAGSAGDKFDETSPTFKLVRALADLRRAYPALTRGAQYPRWSDPSGAGLYAYSRIYRGQEVLVVLNFSGDARSADMWLDAGASPAGARLEDALTPGYRVAVRRDGSGGSKTAVDVPPYGARVLVRSAASRARTQSWP